MTPSGDAARRDRSYPGLGARASIERFGSVCALGKRGARDRWMMHRRIRGVHERAHCIDENLGVERLHEIRPSSGNDSIVRFLGNVPGDEHRALTEPRISSNGFLEDHVSGLAVPQTQIENECVHTPRRQRGMCFIATGHGDDIETMAREKQSESLTDGRLVVDDEHTGLVHRTGRQLRSERRGRPPGG